VKPERETPSTRHISLIECSAFFAAMNRKILTGSRRPWRRSQPVARCTFVFQNPESERRVARIFTKLRLNEELCRSMSRTGRRRATVSPPTGLTMKRDAGESLTRREGGRENLVSCSVALVLTGVAALAFEDLHVAWTANLAIALAYLVVANTLCSITLLLAMLRRREVSRVSSLFFLVPPLAALIAWAILGERLSGLAWAGMAVAAAGVALATRDGRRTTT
jgi:uncharacterized membrane protein